MTIKAPAKLNLSLNVFSQKRDDGFYPVKFLNCQLALADEIEIRPSKKTKIICSSLKLKKEDNLVYQALRLLPKKKEIEINIKKMISVKCGLAGGSSDAAAVLNYLNKEWGLRLSEKQLLEIGVKLGMDVCYCLIGGLCLVEGTGEKVKKLDFSLPKISLIIINPAISKRSTAWAYKNLDLQKIGKNEKKLENLLAGIKRKDIRKIAANLHNDFEYSMSKYFPIIETIKNDLINCGALRAMLCGSGLSVFGIYEDGMVAQKAYNKLKEKWENIFLTETK